MIFSIFVAVNFHEAKWLTSQNLNKDSCLDHQIVKPNVLLAFFIFCTWFVITKFWRNSFSFRLLDVNKETTLQPYITDKDLISTMLLLTRMKSDINHVFDNFYQEKHFCPQSQKVYLESAVKTPDAVGKVGYTWIWLIVETFQ